MTLSGAVATTPDLLRLVAVPVLAWTAVRDVKTRRISSGVWIPLGALGALLLAWDGWLAWSASGDAWAREFLLPVAVSLGFVVPIAYLFWWVGGFGGADAKALMVVALLFPAFPAFDLGSRTFPLTSTPIETFSFTILTNAVVVGLAIPIALAVANAAAGRIGLVSLVGWPVSWRRIPTTHGKLLETPDGRGLGRGGLDLDALRMYLRWRGATFAELRRDPATYRDPKSLPAEPNPPTDGAVDAANAVPDGGEPVDGLERNGDDREDENGSVTLEFDLEAVASDAEYDDPWGAAAFLEDIEGTAYGTTPEALRDGLDVLAEKDRVWITPGTPFLVPIFVGLLIALVYGDLLIGLLF
ncbi:A24 family peptidase C-terminal domain-containing protein [Natrialbaceae archaeon GCM10025810]|uniref:A24 family peptidase n=1 Tax=Halovalidus salilacus TaxID=3075124 RepID=UPI00361C307F